MIRMLPFSLRSLSLCAALLCGPLLSADAVPRPEYPNPQFERSQWQSLNGAWAFAFDDADKGVAGSWYAHGLPAARKITVPYCFESKLSGIGETGFHPVSWYQRTVRLPGNWSGEHVLLHFGAVYYQASVWLNGQHLGDHEGGNVPFAFDITSALRRGDNTLTVRAYNPPTDRSIPRGKQYWKPKSAAIFYTRTSGIWQPVWVETTGRNCLQYVQVTAGQDGTAYFEGVLAHHSDQPLKLEITILDGASTAASASAQTHEDQVSGSASVSNPKLWSPDAPNLYQVRYRLLDGSTVVDEVQSYFGFRTIGVANGRVTVNGRPVYMKLLLDQGYWPESILTPPSEAAIQRDIDLIQSMGFNGVRKHQKVADPRFLYWADKRGLLVSGEIADAYEFTPEEVDRFTREWIAAVERDYNHPSIIIWNAINESWGVPDLTDGHQQAYLKELYQLTHTLDSTRLVIDNEGWEHTDQTDLMALHDYEKSGDALYERYKDVTPQSTTLPKNHKAAILPGYRYNGSPLYLSEMGGIAYIPEGASVPPESWGYSGVEKTQQAALDRLTQLFGGLARLNNLAGFCYTQLTDVEQEINGLATYDRKPKFPAEKIKALNDTLK